MILTGASNPGEAKGISAFGSSFRKIGVSILNEEPLPKWSIFGRYGKKLQLQGALIPGTEAYPKPRRSLPRMYRKPQMAFWEAVNG